MLFFYNISKKFYVKKFGWKVYETIRKALRVLLSEKVYKFIKKLFITKIDKFKHVRFKTKLMKKIAIVDIKGGLGNQLFQTAYALYLKSKNINTYCDISFYETNMKFPRNLEFDLDKFG